MNQLTLRHIPEELDNLIRKISKKRKKSINKTIISILEEALGIKNNSGKKRDVSSLAKTWSEEEFKTFKSNTKIFEKIDSEIWK